MAKLITLSLNGNTVEEIESLKKKFGVTTNAALFKKVLTLGKVATDNQSDDIFTYMTPQGRHERIMLKS